ncbi:MAG TPA: cupin domain-containing protein [Solirubrobacterales bacterium]|nr:cupin domain-containing protein [Solirubrobacterales bacterium]
MSRYAVANLKECDDVVDGPEREIRFARKQLESAELGVTYERFDPNVVSSDGHAHEVQEEAYVVVSGSGRVKLDDEVVELRQWDVVRVAPEVVRAFDAGPDGLELIAIGGAKPEGGDGHIVRDRWPA